MNPKIGNDHHYKTCFFKRPDSCRFKRPTPRSSEIVVEEHTSLSHPEFFEFQDVIKIKNKTTIFS